MLSQLQPIITIAIPTYNRASSLRSSLNSIVKQVNAIECGWNKIEVLVSDNCSTDETPIVVQDIGLTHVNYVRNTSNLGMEGNFLSCFQQAQGTLVWIFSDDDLLIDGVLKKLLALAEEKRIDLIYLRPKYLFGELDSFSSESVNFSFEQVCVEYFALRANGVLSFLSAVIVNKHRYLELREDENIKRYSGTWLAHYEWIYTLLASGDTFFMASKSVIRARTGATGGYDLFKVFGEYYLAIANEKLPNRPRMREDFKKAMLYFHIPGFILRTRLNNFGNFEYQPHRIAKQVINSYGYSWFYRIVIKTMLFDNKISFHIAYRYSQLYARVWMSIRRLFTRKYPLGK